MIVNKIIKIKKNILNLNFKKIDIVKLYGYYQIIRLVLNLLYNSKYYFKSKIKLIPYVKNKITEEQAKIIKEIQTEFKSQVEDIAVYNTLPKTGLQDTKIIELFKQMETKYTLDYKGGKVSGATYSNNKELDKLLGKLFLYFNKSNPLHTNLYPCIRKMENECISIMIDLFKGDENTCGTFTSGGTESILMACKTYRDYSRKEKNIVKPEIIVSSSGHCAFNKACKYFNIKLVTIQSRKDGLYDLNKLKNSINKNTILIVGSTPSYNLGLIDQVNKLNDISIENNIPLHLDACIGSFLINFTNYNYGFSLPGVTSISADFHKYGNTPKGASSILYKNKEIMKYQYYIDKTWSGGIYATSSFSGSRCGNIVALTWATLMSYGENGYLQNYQKIIELNDYFIESIKIINDVFVYGNPKLSIIAVGSNTVNINIVCEMLKKKGWEINVIQNPNGFHFCLTQYHTKEIITEFIIDLSYSIEYLVLNKIENKKYSPCIYGTMKKVGDDEIIDDVITNYLHVVNNVKLNI